MIALNILFLIFLEGVLSLDNALALALLVRELPKEQQKRALTYGMVGAYAFRLGSLFVLTWIVKITWVKLLGAAYLLYLVFSYYRKKDEQDKSSFNSGVNNFWKTVVLVELTDIAFSIDSILASVAISQELAVVFAGACIGILMMRVASVYMIRLLDAYPRLEASAYNLIGLVAIKLGIETFQVHFSPWLYYPLMAGIIALGFVKEKTCDTCTSSPSSSSSG